MKAKKERDLTVEESCNYTVRGLFKKGREQEKKEKELKKNLTAALAEILVVLHKLNLTLSCTYLQEFLPLTQVLEAELCSSQIPFTNMNQLHWRRKVSRHTIFISN